MVIAPALEQTWPNREIIGVAENSRKETLAITRFSESHGMHDIFQSDHRSSAFYTHSPLLTPSKWIKFLDADD